MGKFWVPGSPPRVGPLAIERRVQSFAPFAGSLGIGVGLIVLLGWLLDVPPLKGILPGLALMQPNTALSLGLAGVALLGLRREEGAVGFRRLAWGCAGLAAAIGVLTLAEYVFAVNLGIDTLLFGNVPGAIGPPSPGRMSLMTAGCVSGLGIALLLLRARSGAGCWASQTLASVVTLLALLDLIGYAYGVRFLYMISAYSSMALHTALTLFILGLGTLAARTRFGLMRRFMADDAGGWLLRNLLPLAVSLPLMMGGIRVFGEEIGLFNPRFGSAVLVLANIISLIGLLAWAAGRLSHLDWERRRAERSVVRQEAWFRTTLLSIGDAVMATDGEGRVTFMNPVAEDLTGWRESAAVGQLLGEVFPIVNETTRQAVENPATRALRDGVIVGLANHTILISRDGTERAIDDSAAPIRDGDRIIGAVLVFRDMGERRRREQELEGRERQFHTLAESIPQLAWMAEPDGNIFWYNRRWYDYTGTTIEQMAGWGWRSVHDPEELPRVLERWGACIASGQPFDMVFPLKGKDGVFHPFLTRVMPVKDDEGRVSRWIGTNTDITESKRVEEELRDARSRLESTLSAGEIGTWEIDIENNTVRADRNLARFFGVTPDEAAGGMLEAYTKAIHPDDRDRVAVVMARALDTGGHYEAEYRLVGPDGSIRWVVARGRVERGVSGQGVLLPGVVVDISERKRAEDQFREGEARFRTLFDSMDEGFCVLEMIFDPDGRPINYRFLEMNPAFERHSGLSGVVGKTIQEVIPSLEAFWFETYGRVAQTGEPIRFVNEAKSLGGRWFDVSAFRLGGEGSPRVAVLFSDISARKEVEAERGRLENDLRRIAADLSEADRRKDEFLATLAHELRNPLAPIRNGLQIMKLDGDDRHAVDEARTLMERQVTHMVRLIDDLMDISRITRNKLELRKERVELATIIQTAVETSRPLVEAAGHELAVTLPARPITIDADVTRLAQVFANLLNNAAKYTERGGDIALIAERQGRDVVVTIRDNGVGIPPEMLPDVFVMFTQVDRTLERSQGGLGIGLSLVKTLVEMHGGSVEARSGGHGLGSQFVVRLPAVITASPEPTAPEAGTRSVGPASSLRILVVDDNRDSARTLARILKLMGHETRTAHDGGEAVEVAEMYRPEIMLLDIGMPVMNGYEVARTIRERPWGRDVLIVALTGWGQEGDRRRSQEAGIDKHLVKPVDPNDLEKLLAEIQVGSAAFPVRAKS